MSTSKKSSNPFTCALDYPFKHEQVYTVVAGIAYELLAERFVEAVERLCTLMELSEADRLRFRQAAVSIRLSCVEVILRDVQVPGMLRQCCEGFAEGTKDDPILPFIREYVKEKNLKLTNFEITRGLNLPYGRVNRLVEILREERLQAESEKENGSSSQ